LIKNISDDILWQSVKKAMQEQKYQWQKTFHFDPAQIFTYVLNIFLFYHLNPPFLKKVKTL